MYKDVAGIIIRAHTPEIEGDSSYIPDCAFIKISKNRVYHLLTTIIAPKTIETCSINLRKIVNNLNFNFC